MEIDLTKAISAPKMGPASRDSIEDIDVGARVAKLRAERNWTLQQAAQDCGVSFSTLSKIERGELSPTVNTLSKLAKGMGLSLAQLLESEHPPYASARRSISRASDGQAVPTGTCDNQLLATDLTNRRMTPIRTRVRARSPEAYSEWATYAADIFLWVLSGRLVIYSQNYAPVHLDPGDSIYYDASSGHLWVSEGDEDAVVVWIYAE